MIADGKTQQDVERELNDLDVIIPHRWINSVGYTFRNLNVEQIYVSYDSVQKRVYDRWFLDEREGSENPKQVPVSCEQLKREAGR